MSDVMDPAAGALARRDTAMTPDAGERLPGDPLPAEPPTPGTGEPAAADPSVMTLVDHLSELRRRLAISIAAVLVGTVAGFWFAPQIIDLLLQPLPGGKVVFLTLSGGFMLHLRIAIIVGILLSLPVILYQVWAFVAPGLTPRERRATLPWIPLSVIFFLLGTLVAYVTMPYAVAFLLSFQIEGSLEALTSSEAYFSFVTFIFLIFGLVMQFPIVLVFLTRLRVLSIERLKQARRYVLMGIVVFAVVITPGGDPISPLVLSGTMYVLYEVSIFMLRRQERRAESDA